MTEEQKRRHQQYMNQYNRENYDRYSVMFPKGKKEVYKELAEARGRTLNGLINALLDAALLDAERRKFHIDSRKNQ